MDKRYQVFVSSTYVDLIEERQIVFQTLMEMDCIPAGMEYFSAIDEDQFEFIKKVIDDCDYYVLIMGGKYGSLAEGQISYTEKEFDYAVSIGKKVVVFVHKDPDAIPTGKSEADPKRRKKLELFKEKAMTGRVVEFWEDPKDLRGLIAVSLNKTIKMFPAVGWVRADQIASNEILQENRVQKEKLDALKLENEKYRYEYNTLNLNDLADEKTEFTVRVTSRNMNGVSRDAILKRPLVDIFAIIAPSIPLSKSQYSLGEKLARRVYEIQNYEVPYNPKVNAHDWETLIVQFEIYGWIKTEKHQVVLLPKGKQKMFANRIIRTD